MGVVRHAGTVRSRSKKRHSCAEIGEEFGVRRSGEEEEKLTCLPVV